MKSADVIYAKLRDRIMRSAYPLHLRRDSAFDWPRDRAESGRYSLTWPFSASSPRPYCPAATLVSNYRQLRASAELVDDNLASVDRWFKLPMAVYWERVRLLPERTLDGEAEIYLGYGLFRSRRESANACRGRRAEAGRQFLRYVRPSCSCFLGLADLYRLDPSNIETRRQ